MPSARAGVGYAYSSEVIMKMICPKHGEMPKGIARRRFKRCPWFRLDWDEFTYCRRRLRRKK